MREAGSTAGMANTAGAVGTASTARAVNARSDNALPTWLCHLSDLPDGSARGFDPFARGRDTVFAVRRGASVRVWADRCPHHGTPMPWRKDAYLNAAGDRIVCAAHGALFDIDSGLCVQGPCLGERLRPVPFTLTEAGELLLTAPLPSAPQHHDTTPGDRT
jgi:nitrite reductase/ring-hydroxylating ferredoxin subunit